MFRLRSRTKWRPKKHSSNGRLPNRPGSCFSLSPSVPCGDGSLRRERQELQEGRSSPARPKTTRRPAMAIQASHLGRIIRRAPSQRMGQRAAQREAQSRPWRLQAKRSPSKLQRDPRRSQRLQGTPERVNKAIMLLGINDLAQETKPKQTQIKAAKCF